MRKSDGESRRTVLVTGASSGIGAAIAIEFARQGASVGCLSRRGSLPRLEPAPVGDATARGSTSDEATLAERLTPITADVTDDEMARRAVEDFVALNGRLDGLVNAAGFQCETPSVTVGLAEVRSILETNFVSSLRMCQLAHPFLRVAGGFIVNIGSFFDGLGVPGFAAYSASKAAIGSLTRTLGVEWARDGITVLNVAPGYVETDLNRNYLTSSAGRDAVARMIPVRRAARPQEIGRLVAALAFNAQPILTGETIYVDGGQRVRL